MDAVTYPDSGVKEFISTFLIPLKLSPESQEAKDFNLKWTPTLVTLDGEGREGHRTVGFLAPDELIASLQLGIGKTFFEGGRFDDAIAWFDRVIKEYPKSDYAAEAVFYRGVGLYKSKKDPTSLRVAYDKLTAEFPSSEWTKRAQPYRLIGA
jgi:tetratricopeptide (TPR) repeat protein